MHTIHSTVFVYAAIGWGCSPTSSECALPASWMHNANPTKSNSTELVYNFPIKAPFLILFVDAYLAGKHSSLNGFETCLVACCSMTGFASMEPIVHANTKNFASASMKFQLHKGFCHTIVLDKDSKFNSVHLTFSISIGTPSLVTTTTR
jgi:hypothetical protein